MKATNGITFDTADVPHVYQALHHFTDALEKYKHWIRTTEGKPLPGMETALQEIDKDLAEIRGIQMRVYDTCFKTSTS